MKERNRFERERLTKTRIKMKTISNAYWHMLLVLTNSFIFLSLSADLNFAYKIRCLPEFIYDNFETTKL